MFQAVSGDPHEPLFIPQAEGYQVFIVMGALF